MPRVADWIRRADEDWRAVAYLNSRRRKPYFGVICSHCYETAQKYLKAYLVSQRRTPPSSESLLLLLTLCSRHDADVKKLKPVIAMLKGFGTRILYPGANASRQDAQDSIAAAKRLRLAIRKMLGL